MVILSQRDPRWSRTTMGNSGVTLGRAGCLVTCCSMASDYFNHFHKPDELARGLKFTDGGLLIWESLPSMCNFKMTKRFYFRDTTIIDEALRNPEKVCVLEVDGNHFVVAIGKVPLTNIYRIADPWFGDRTFSPRYKKITGGAILTRL